MSTISVTEDVKEALLRVASELQIRWGRRVDLNEAIRYLLTKGIKRPDLLEQACRPILGFEDAYKELRKERIKNNVIKVLEINNKENIDDLINYIENNFIEFDSSNLDKNIWNLKKYDLLKLKEKIESISKPLKDWGIEIKRGLYLNLVELKVKILLYLLSKVLWLYLNLVELKVEFLISLILSITSLYLNLVELKVHSNGGRRMRPPGYI